MPNPTWIVERGLIETPRLPVLSALLIGVAALNIASAALALLAA